LKPIGFDTESFLARSRAAAPLQNGIKVASMPAIQDISPLWPVLFGLSLLLLFIVLMFVGDGWVFIPNDSYGIVERRAVAGLLAEAIKNAKQPLVPGIVMGAGQASVADLLMSMAVANGTIGKALAGE
jgi:hypothetical protein